MAYTLSIGSACSISYFGICIPWYCREDPKARNYRIGMARARKSWRGRPRRSRGRHTPVPCPRLPVLLPLRTLSPGYVLRQCFARKRRQIIATLKRQFQKSR